MRSRLIGLALVLVVAGVVAGYRYHHDLDRWEPDAAIYLRMALEDRGLARDAARAESDRFMLTTSEAHEPSSRGFYGPSPPPFYARQFALFATRPLFPYLGAALYPRLGPHGLQAISAAAYVLATGAMFALLLIVAPPWLAALGSLAFAANPLVLTMASYGMTDELALLCWIAVLGAMAAYVRAPSPALLAAVAVAAAALAFTRPAVYLPVGAALGALAATRTGAVSRNAAFALVAVAGGVAIVFFAYAALIHGPGLGDQLRWQYDFARATGRAPESQGFLAWYARAELKALATLLVHELVVNAGPFAVALAAIGVALQRRTSLAAVAIGAACATVAALVVNPLEFARTVELPLTPVVTIFATAALAALTANLTPARR